MVHETLPPPDPWALFAQWLAVAEEGDLAQANALMLATMGEDGMPFVRAVTLKWFDGLGLVFYTHRQSRKGEALAGHPKAGACFVWPELKHQVRFEGEVFPVPDDQSDAYFATRPRQSQIGAWAAEEPCAAFCDPATAKERVAEVERRYAGKPVPRPPHWGGYRLVPQLVEFLQEHKTGLVERFLYRRTDALWNLERLCS